MEDEAKKFNKYQEMLKGLIDEMITQKTKDEATEEAAKINETVAKALEENAALKAQIEAIKNMPYRQVGLPIPGVEKETAKFWYKGRDIRTQGIGFEQKFGPQFKLDNDKRERYAKFIIDVITKTTYAEGAAANGGNAVPVEYQNDIYALARLGSIALNECTVFDMSSNQFNVPLESGQPTAYWIGESTTITRSEGTVGQLNLVLKKLAVRSRCSNEFLDDTVFDVTTYLTGLFAEKIALELDDSIFNAGGNSTFTGALSGATTNTVSCAATGTSPNRHVQITVDELSLAISKLTDNKLRGAKFYVHPNSLHYLRVQEDGAGNKVWAQPGNGVPGKFWEYPYVMSAQIGSATPGAASPFALFGNLKNYAIGRKATNMKLIIDPYSNSSTDQTEFIMISRWDGGYLAEAAMCVIKTHA